MPFIHSRVTIPPNDNYINASFVSTGMHKYILTQAPMENTLHDFFTMIAVHGIGVVVTLGSDRERDPRNPKQVRQKMFRYWPQEMGETIKTANVVVSCEDVEDKQQTHGCVIRHLSVQHLTNPPPEGVNSPQKVLQYHFLAWQDHAVPEDSAIFLRFTALCREVFKAATAQIKNRGAEPGSSESSGAGSTGSSQKLLPVVHCSAGVGRSGTFCAVDTIMCMNLQQSEALSHAYSIVRSLKLGRRYTVQNYSQFEFIVRCANACATAQQ